MLGLAQAEKCGSGQRRLAMHLPIRTGESQSAESWHFQYRMVRHYEMLTASRKAVLSPPALSNPWNVIV